MDLKTLIAFFRFEKRRFLKNPLPLLAAGFLFLFLLFVCLQLGQNVTKIQQFFRAGSKPGMTLWLAQLALKSLNESASSLTQTSPIPAIFYFLIIQALPLYIMLLGCDQLASDISRKHLRFLLLKVDRLSIYISRFLSHLLLFWVIAIPQVIMALLFLIGVDPATSWLAALTILPRILLAVMLFSIPFIALMSLAGVVTAQPFLAMMLGTGYWFFIGVISALMPVMDKAYERVQYLSPTVVKYLVISDSLGDMLLGVGLILLYSAVFLGGGLWIFLKRNI